MTGMIAGAALSMIERHPIVPVIVIDDASDAAALGEALVDGGLPVVEVTLRTPSGLAALTRMAEIASLIVGAGTVTTIDQVEQAAAAGAAFIVSPGFDAQVVERAEALGLLALPGIATASEAQAAQRAGLHAVKAFPIKQLGGIGFITALAGPFPALRFMPSGGLAPQDTAMYLAQPSVIALGAGWVAPRALIADRRFDIITENAALAAQLAEPSGDRS